MRNAGELLEEGLGYERGGALDRALEVYSTVLRVSRQPADQARALVRIAHTYRVKCEWDLAMQGGSRAAAIAASAGLHALQGEALNAIATVWQSRGKFAEALDAYAEIRQVTSDPRVLGMAAQNSGTVCAIAGDLETAEQKLLEAHTFFREAADDSGQAHVLNSYAAIALDRQEWSLAEQRAAEAVDAARRVNDLDLLALARHNHAEALCGLGRYPEAEVLATAALGQFQITGNTLGRIHCMRTLGLTHQQQANLPMARRMLTRALQLSDQIGATSESSRLRDHLAALPES